jgi:hypothetical protein
MSVVIQLIPNQSNRRSTVQWYFPRLVFPVSTVAFAKRIMRYLLTRISAENWGSV